MRPFIKPPADWKNPKPDEPHKHKTKDQTQKTASNIVNNFEVKIVKDWELDFSIKENVDTII